MVSAGLCVTETCATPLNGTIALKTTKGWERTPFHITRNELVVAEERCGDWRLVRLWNFAREPRAFELRPLLEAHVPLMAPVIRPILITGRKTNVRSRQRAEQRGHSVGAMARPDARQALQLQLICVRPERSDSAIATRRTRLRSATPDLLGAPLCQAHSEFSISQLSRMPPTPGVCSEGTLCLPRCRCQFRSIAASELLASHSVSLASFLQR